MPDDELPQDAVRDPIIAKLLALVPELDLLARNDTTWHEVDVSVFDISDMYGRRK